MDFTSVLKQAQRNRMDRGIPPSLVEEAPCSVQVVEVIFVRLASPKFHIGDLEVGPEMTGRVAVRSLVVVGSPVAVLEPIDGVVLMHILWMRGEEFRRLRPQGRDAFGRIVEVDGEAVRLVVVFHVPEDVVVDVAEEVDFWLHAPVVAGVGKRRVFVEHAAVPATHLVVGHQVAVLHCLLFEDLGGFFEQGVVDP